MSASDDLYRSALHARLAKLPPVPPWETTAPGADGGDEDMDMHEDEDEEEEEEEDKGDVLGEMKTLDISASEPKHRRVPPSRSFLADFSPLSASSHFSQSLIVSLPSRSLDVRIYYTPPTPRDPGGKGTVLIGHHGAGSSALSFALLSSAIRERSGGDLGMLVFDCRGHGKTVSIAFPDSNDQPNGDLLLSLPSLSSDLLALIKTLFPTPSTSPSFLLVGHSMGASITLSALPSILAEGYSVVGCTIIDVVEGTALEALPHMRHLLLSRPKGFDTIEEAIQWHITTKTIRNSLSARTSVPSLFLPSQVDLNAPPTQPAFIWRAPLESTEPFWEGWFKGLSSTFLTARTARLLVLAGTERLDKALMIGQMQGKFQLVVLPDTGHYVQEDAPERLAEVLVEFWRRNDRVVKGVKKVGEL